MMVRAIVLTVLLAVLVVHAGAREPRIAPLGEVELHRTAATTRVPGDRCSAGRSDYYWAVGDWFTGNEVYAALADPDDCSDCGGGWQADDVTIFLYWTTADTCRMSAVATIREVEECGETLVPGDPIVTSDPTEVGITGTCGLWAVTIELPQDTPILTDPFFVAVEFMDPCGNLPKVVTDSGPCTEGSSWNHWGSGWQDMCDFGFPGDLSLYATLQCQGPTAVEPSSWTTIKAIYREE
ncbi:MAG: hypothetical protein GF405_09850 [Candidatus Eisenbacteria bacterium]|nr:hypothetical protein [Candidatus Eisenbacteria bacterium]